VRQLPAVLALSAAVHAGAVAWVSTREREPETSRELAPRVALVEPAPSPAPIEVVLVEPVEPVAPVAPIATPAPEAIVATGEEPAVPDTSPARRSVEPRASRTASPAAPTRNTTAGDAAIATGATTPSAAEPPDEKPLDEKPTSGKHPLLGMRKARLPRLVAGVPTGSWDDTTNATSHDATEATAVEPSGRLHPDGGGTFRSDLGAVTAKVARDGSVTLTDKRNLKLSVPVPSPQRIGNAIARWYRDDTKPVGTLGPSEATKPRLPGDHATGQDTRPDHGQTVPVVGGSFDVTDALMRRKGYDPYASQKLAYLDATRDERVQLGRAHRREQLRRATELMQANLDEAYRSLRDPRALRQALFELWDECEETGEAGPGETGRGNVDGELVEASRRARQLVIGFIRAKLPAGSPDAYTAAELARLNRMRRSRAPFTPYE
jgi:hypothetical protein